MTTPRKLAPDVPALMTRAEVLARLQCGREFLRALQKFEAIRPVNPGGQPPLYDPAKVEALLQKWLRFGRPVFARAAYKKSA